MEQSSNPGDKKFLMSGLLGTFNSFKDLKQKNMKMQFHVQAVADSLHLFCWYVSGGVEDYVDEKYSAIDFYGNKVLGLK